MSKGQPSIAALKFDTQHCLKWGVEANRSVIPDTPELEGEGLELQALPSLHQLKATQGTIALIS